MMGVGGLTAVSSVGSDMVDFAGELDPEDTGSSTMSSKELSGRLNVGLGIGLDRVAVSY